MRIANMSIQKSYRVLPGVLGMTALLLTACPAEEPSAVCGPNTEAVDGKCVSTVDEAPCADGASRNPDTGQCEPNVECGAGTTYNSASGACEPDFVCGDGTTFNEATGQCDPDVVCGDGTTFDPETGICRPDVVCGDGTHLDAETGTCVPDENCGEGTTFDPLTLSCVPDVVCGPGLVDINGVCLSALEVIVAEADALESATDLNDPAFGGTPEAITLEAEGEQVVLSGTISRPVDHDGDGAMDQDRDVWRFTGTAGQVLRIRVLSTGAFQPAFTVTGPNEYYREPQVGFTIEADRQVVLPYDGEYDLTVLPSLVLQGASAPLGADDATYAAIIEKQPWPTPATVNILADGTMATASGSLLNLSDNFFTLTPEQDTPIVIEVSAPTGNTTPVLLLFRADGTFVQQAEFDEEDGIETAVTGAFVALDPGLVAVLDWQTSNGIDVPFDLFATQLETVDIGAIAVDEQVQLPLQHITGLGGVEFLFEATAGQVVLTDFANVSANVMLLGPRPSELPLFIGTDPSWESVFYARETGTYRWIVVNTETSDENASVSIESFTPHVAGPFDGATEQSASFAGDVIRSGQRPTGEWFVVETSGPSIVRFDFDFAFGVPSFDVYDTNAGGFAIERRIQFSTDPNTLRAYRPEPGLTLARFDPGDSGNMPDPWVHDWSVDVAVIPMPTLAEVEPNDDMSTTQAIAEVPGGALRLLGSVASDEFDFYTLTLDRPLDPGEVLQVEIESLTGTSANYLRFRLPGSDPEADPAFLAQSAPLSRFLLHPGDPTGPWVLEVDGTSFSGPVIYMLEVKRVALPTEAEPNDTRATAHDLGTLAPEALPVEVYGHTRSDEIDVFKLSLEQPLPAGTVLRVRAEDVTESYDFKVALFDGAEAPLESLDHEAGDFLVPMPAAGSLFIEVKGESDTRPDLYRLIIDTLSDVVEVEPNESAAEASALPAVTAGATVSTWGSVWDDKDVYQINFDAPPAADEVVAVRWFTKTTDDDLRVTVVDAAEQALVTSQLPAGELFVTPAANPDPLFVRVESTRGTADDYPEVYSLEVERIGPGTVEIEPNDDTAGATTLTTPAHAYGLFYDGEDHDYYAVTLGADLVAGEKLIVEAVSPYAMELVTVSVFDDTGAVIASASDLYPYLEVDLPTTTAGTTYYISVVSFDGVGTGERYAYEMMVDIGVP